MARRLRFAPVSDAPSRWTDVAAGYFLLSGGFQLALLIAVLIAAARGSRDAPRVEVLDVVLSLVFGAGMIWTGILLGRRSRAGLKIAVVFVILGILSTLTDPAFDALDLLWHAISVGILVTLWRDFSRHGEVR